ncbi:MAG: DUF192 domain-containing protein [Anaerolineaceae bacterium]
MRLVSIQNTTRPLSQPILAGWADTFFARFRGLMFNKGISLEEGLLLVQPYETRADAAIHMLFMNYDISVIWMDKNSIVVDSMHAKRWFPFYMPNQSAQYILEIRPERLAEFRIGDQIRFEEAALD